ncbi:MAG TPA: hypothetical protein VGG80_13585 [Acidobacteriaceae bacterium]
METTYRFRFLIYLAAFMLVMSVCFVYAEPLPSQPYSSHLLFQVAPQHGSFLPTSADEPTFDPAALRTAAPAISPVVLQQLEDASHPHHRFLHRAKRAGVRLAPAAVHSESSVAVESSSSATIAR